MFSSQDFPLPKAVPDKIEALYQEGIQQQRAIEYDQAIEQFTKLLQITPHPDAISRLATIYLSTGRIQQALTTYRQGLKLLPNHPFFLHGMASCYREMGNFDRAALYFGKTLKVIPDNVESLLSMVLTRDYSLNAKPVKDLLRLHESLSPKDQSRFMVCFALGKVYEGHHDYRRAFDYYDEANRLRFPQLGYDEAKQFAYFDAIESFFTADLFAQMKDIGFECADTMPIFVVGMPRSGTSLVEQILASHSAVYGAGELPIMPYIADTFIPQLTSQPYPHAINHLQQAAFKLIAERYLRQMRSFCPDKSRYIVDKRVANYFHIGLIRILFPHAPIIHCVRDPMDTCWSLFRLHFVGDHPYCYDQRTLGRYYSRYQQLMRHWHRALPGEIYDLPYDQLVKQPESAIKSLLKHCHLPWEKNCMAFYRTKRAVSTASMRQVRRPIFVSSIKSWQPVADKLAPLRKALRYAD